MFAVQNTLILMKMMHLMQANNMGVRHIPEREPRPPRTNHRTLFKCICNPILRMFGWQIVSMFIIETDEFLGYDLRRFDYDLTKCKPL